MHFVWSAATERNKQNIFFCYWYKHGSCSSTKYWVTTKIFVALLHDIQCLTIEGSLLCNCIHSSRENRTT